MVILKEFVSKFFSFKKFEEFVNITQNYSKKRRKKFIYEALFSQEVYDYINEFYENSEFKSKSYLDFFWSLRSVYYSFLNVLLEEIPIAKVYHTISTGYAGLFASICKIKHPNSRLMLTEHGIYTRERKMDITIADWSDRNHDAYNPNKNISLYKNIWAKSFQLISNITYKYCDEIISLNEKNNLIQISEGAKRKKVYFVRNGINVERFKFRQRNNINKNSIKLGFLGRVVKIKDVKTFIKAVKIVIDQYPNTEVLVAGPTSEDKEYFKSCQNMIKILKVEENIKFIGLVKPEDFLQEIDLMILTSLSEGQPLVLSEANASGVPCVATDVGGCKEMLEGGAEDSVGISGLITKSVNPSQTANAIIKFIENDELYKKCSINGKQRVDYFYNENFFLANYKKIYDYNIEESEVY
jgi:glycosyltransferase involved in cell wall biosynthesis